jgi:hypothetical protein
MTAANLEALLAQADATDRSEGLLAYRRYHMVMTAMAQRYGTTVTKAAAAFCSLSPNSDYYGNLRSAVTVLHGVAYGWSLEDIQVSTYRHCLHRAYSYVAHDVDFLSVVKGPKITAFYMNVTNPEDERWVTVDGHMVAAWRGERLTMKEAIPKTGEYRAISAAVKQLAFRNFMRPLEFQATLWFTRKRVLNIKADLQRDLLLPPDDVWQTVRDVERIQPYPRRKQVDEPVAAPAGLVERQDIQGALALSRLDRLQPGRMDEAQGRQARLLARDFVGSQSHEP